MSDHGDSNYHGYFDERCMVTSHEIGHMFNANHEDYNGTPSYAKATHGLTWHGLDIPLCIVNSKELLHMVVCNSNFLLIHLLAMVMQTTIMPNLSAHTKAQ